MQHIDTGSDGVDVHLSWDDVLLLNNALNEVCNGVDFDDGEFQTRLGLERGKARALLQQINRLFDARS